MDRYVDDAGRIVAGWLVRLVGVLGLLGLMAFDAFTIGLANVSVPDSADSAARAAAESWSGSHDIRKAYEAAVADATVGNPANRVETKHFTVDADGTVHLVLDRHAHTLLVRRISGIAAWADVRSEGTGRLFQ